MENAPANIGFEHEPMPESLETCDYYVGNDEFAQQELAVKNEIIALCVQLEPWQVEVAKHRAKGMSLQNIAKEVKFKYNIVKDALTITLVHNLVHFFMHLERLQDGPNEIHRKQMLWRIAVRNEEKDPKEARGALAELNKMAAPKGGASNAPINIIINNEVMPRGKLDG